VQDIDERAGGGNAPTRAEMKKVPIWRNPWVIAAIAGMATVTLIRPCLRHIPDPPPVHGYLPAYSLTDQDGEAFGSEDLRDHVYVVTFFFTSCVTICPRVMSAAKALQDRYLRAGVDIRLVSITVDPEHDTPERLKQQAEKVGADLSTWTFLTGTRAELEALIVGGFKTYMGEREEGADGMMDIGHGSRIVLVDTKGGVRGHYEITKMGLDEVYHRSQHVLSEQR
jgi:protein SCO1/2